MKRSHKLEINLNDAVVTPGPNRPPYQVIQSVYLEVKDFKDRSYGLYVYLEPDCLETLNNGEFTERHLKYCYELTAVGELSETMLSSGVVNRCPSFESTLRRRVVSLATTHTVAAELLHEAIGTTVLCDIPVYDNQEQPQLAFLSAVRQTTPYADGVSKAGPIVSHRFFINTHSPIPGLTGKRRFIVEHASLYGFNVLGIHTIWRYTDPTFSDAPSVTYTDSALGKGAVDKLISADGEAHSPREFRFTPMTAEEVIAHMRTTSLPPL